jgi:hypothetical protein
MNSGDHRGLRRVVSEMVTEHAIETMKANLTGEGSA